MSLELVVPDPSPTLDVRSICSTVVEWAQSTDDIGAINDNNAKLAAIATYVAETSRTGLAEIEATRRRLEVRIGELAPIITRAPRRPTLEELENKCPQRGHLLTRQDSWRYRQMAANADLVEELIAESTDEDPPSRHRILDAITKRKNDVQTTAASGPRSRHPHETPDKFAVNMTAAVRGLSILAKNVHPDVVAGLNSSQADALIVDLTKAISALSALRRTIKESQ